MTNSATLIYMSQAHHYNEVSDELKEIIGRTPDEFLTYCMRCFPSLLIFTYSKMETYEGEERQKCTEILAKT